MEPTTRGGHDMATGSGTKDDPWVLKTAPGTSEYTMYRDEAADPPALVCHVGSTQLKYHLGAIDDLHAMLKARGGEWLDLGAADEQKQATPGTVERGVAIRRIRSAAGTASGRATAAASACTCRRSSRPSGSPS
jgi:hypothetical protein